jgi:ABC-2 type transport system permease protein
VITALAVAGAVIIAALRIWNRRRRKGAVAAPRRAGSDRITGDVQLVAARELRERFRSRIFRIGTLFILLVVAAAIIIPAVNKGKNHAQEVGVVGSLSAAFKSTIERSAQSVDTTVRFVAEPDAAAARSALSSGRIDVALVDSTRLIVSNPISSNDNSVTAQLVQAVSSNLGVVRAFEKAQLSPAQVEILSHPTSLPVSSIHRATGSGSSRGPNPTSIIGVILIFVMLNQYNTWILIGVMEEKSSRVIEVLLAAVRPIQLLTGKVVGIGLVALAQAAAIVAFALLLAKVVGSTLIHGSSPLVVVSTLVWLVLGYAFYCWVYAAAGSMAERQDQVQTLAFPLSLPMIFGYVVALTGASSGSPSELVKVLAYLPPTAPFAMPVLVGFSAVKWWEFLASAAISVACTVLVARAATRIYRRAILRTGRRVPLRDVFSRSVT